MKKVVIVDDISFIRATLRLILQKQNYEIVGEAEDGIEAIKLVKKLSPDIVFMDITMPKLDGIDALIEIKASNPDTKVIMITAMGKDNMVVQAMKAGATNFIVKPFTKETITNVLQRIEW